MDSAYAAKRNLNDFLLFGDGTRMNIYFSNLDRINFQNNNSGGMGNPFSIDQLLILLDYTIQDENGQPIPPQDQQIPS